MLRVLNAEGDNRARAFRPFFSDIFGSENMQVTPKIFREHFSTTFSVLRLVFCMFWLLPDTI